MDCAKLLLDANVDMNIMDGRGHTPLMVAAAVGSYNLLRYLAKCPGVNLNAKVSLSLLFKLECPCEVNTRELYMEPTCIALSC